MIRGMVERLATRLKQNGDDVEGWLRLVRAYMVMGDRDKAHGCARPTRARRSPSDAERLRAAQRRPQELSGSTDDESQYETSGERIRHDAQAAASDHDRRLARGARAAAGAGAQRVARLHRVLLDADRWWPKSMSRPASGFGSAAWCSRARSCAATTAVTLRGRRRRREAAGRLQGHPAGSVPRRAGRRRRRRARCRRRVQGRHRARQA